MSYEQPYLKTAGLLEDLLLLSSLFHFFYFIFSDPFIKFTFFSFSNSVWLCALTLFCFNLYWSLVDLYC